MTIRPRSSSRRVRSTFVCGGWTRTMSTKSTHRNWRSDLNANTGFSFLNLDDNTAQIQLTSGSINLRVRRLDQNDVYEIDTPNLAFTVSQPGSYRVEASEDGTY